MSVSELSQAAGATWRDYLEMCKPRVVALMLLCAVVGMLLATPGMVPVDVLVFGTLGIALVAASAAVVNHIADAEIDMRMARTARRPVAAGRISAAPGLAFSAVLGVAGMGVLLVFINPLTAWLNLASWVGYGLIYTLFLKRATPQNIVIGGLFGPRRPVRLGRRHRHRRTRRTDSGAHHLRLDPTPFLGAGAGPQGRVRSGQHSHAAGHPRGTPHPPPHLFLHPDPSRLQSAAGGHRHERLGLFGRCPCAGRRVFSIGRWFCWPPAIQGRPCRPSASPSST